MEISILQRRILRAALTSHARIVREEAAGGRVRIRAGAEEWEFGAQVRPVVGLERAGLVRRIEGGYVLTSTGRKAAGD